jgi:hypothetical protein
MLISGAMITFSAAAARDTMARTATIINGKEFREFIADSFASDVRKFRANQGRANEELDVLR